MMSVKANTLIFFLITNLPFTPDQTKKNLVIAVVYLRLFFKEHYNLKLFSAFVRSTRCCKHTCRSSSWKALPLPRTWFTSPSLVSALLLLCVFVGVCVCVFCFVFLDHLLFLIHTHTHTHTHHIHPPTHTHPHPHTPTQPAACCAPCTRSCCGAAGPSSQSAHSTSARWWTSACGCR